VALVAAQQLAVRPGPAFNESDAAVAAEAIEQVMRPRSTLGLCRTVYAILMHPPAGASPLAVAQAASWVLSLGAGPEHLCPAPLPPPPPSPPPPEAQNTVAQVE
jgi:hypothetical protein